MCDISAKYSMIINKKTFDVSRMDIFIYYWLGKSYINVIPCGILCEHKTWDAASVCARCATYLYPPPPPCSSTQPMRYATCPNTTLPYSSYFPSKPTECCSHQHVTVQPT